MIEINLSNNDKEDRMLSILSAVSYLSSLTVVSRAQLIAVN